MTAGCSHIILHVPLLGWVGGQLGSVSLCLIPLFGLLPGSPSMIKRVVPSLLRLGVFGTSMMNACSLFILVFWYEIRTALLAGDVSLAWNVWSFSAELSLVRAFLDAAGSLPGVRLGRGSAQFRMVAVGGPVVGKFPPDISGSDDGQSIHFYKDASLSGVIVQMRRLRCVLDVLDGIARHDPSRTRIWSLVHSGMLWLSLVHVVHFVGPIWLFHLIWAFFVFGACVRSFYDSVVAFIHRVVVHRKDVAVRSWRGWVLEDLQVHPYRWPDLVSPALLLWFNGGWKWHYL